MTHDSLAKSTTPSNVQVTSFLSEEVNPLFRNVVVSQLVTLVRIGPKQLFERMLHCGHMRREDVIQN